LTGAVIVKAVGTSRGAGQSRRAGRGAWG